MTSKYCPRCGQSTSHGAIFCSNCGNKFRTQQDRSADKNGRNEPVAESSTWFRCPKCRSEDVKVLPLVAAAGTSSISLMSATIGGSTHGMGVASSATSGMQRTTLSASVAEPQPMQPKDGMVWGFGCGGALATVFLAAISGTAGSNVFTIGAVLSGGAALVASAISRREAAEWNETSYPRERERWRRSFICMRCGLVTDPNELGRKRLTR